jgi:hypothetical protein
VNGRVVQMMENFVSSRRHHGAHGYEDHVGKIRRQRPQRFDRIGISNNTVLK